MTQETHVTTHSVRPVATVAQLETGEGCDDRGDGGEEWGHRQVATSAGLASLRDGNLFGTSGIGVNLIALIGVAGCRMGS